MSQDMESTKSQLSYYENNSSFISEHPDYFSKFETFDCFIRYLPSAPGSDASAGHLFPLEAKRKLLTQKLGPSGVLFDLLLKCSVSFLLLEHFECSASELIKSKLGEEYETFLDGYSKLVESDEVIDITSFEAKLNIWNQIKHGCSKTYFAELESYIRKYRNALLKNMLMLLVARPSAILLNSMCMFYMTDFRSVFPLDKSHTRHLFGVTSV